MRFGIKSGSIAVVTTAVLATAACSSSGQVGAPAGGTGAPGTSAASSAKAPSVPNTSIAPPTSPTSPTSPASDASSGGGAGALSTDQIGKLMLTDKDDPGYTYDASKDNTGVTDTPEVVSSGGSACQTFADAQNGLSTKYGTTAEVDRELTKSSDGHVIEDSIMVMPSADKVKAMISDLNSGLKGCKTLTATIGGSSGTMAPTAIPQLVKADQSGYVNYLTVGGKTVLVTTDVVQVGSAVSVVALVGPVTNDKTALEQMGATMGHLSDIQVARLKKAQGAA